MNKTRHIFAIATIVLALASCGTFGSNPGMTSLYGDVPPGMSFTVLPIVLEDQDGVTYENPFLDETLDAVLRREGFATGRGPILSVRIIEKEIRTSLTGERSVSALLKIESNDQLLARVFSTEKQSEGIDSDPAMYSILDQLILDLRRASDKQNKE